MSDARTTLDRLSDRAAEELSRLIEAWGPAGCRGTRLVLADARVAIEERNVLAVRLIVERVDKLILKMGNDMRREIRYLDTACRILDGPYWR